MTYTLNRPYEGLYIPRAIGVRSIILPPEVCVWVMTSILYDPDEYIRDYEEFKQLASRQKGPYL